MVRFRTAEKINEEEINRGKEWNISHEMTHYKLHIDKRNANNTQHIGGVPRLYRDGSGDSLLGESVLDVADNLTIVETNRQGVWIAGETIQLLSFACVWITNWPWWDLRACKDRPVPFFLPDWNAIGTDYFVDQIDSTYSRVV